MVLSGQWTPVGTLRLTSHQVSSKSKARLIKSLHLESCFNHYPSEKTKGKEHMNKIVARKDELQRIVQTPDHTYAERFDECEKEANELRQMISPKTDCA